MAHTDLILVAALFSWGSLCWLFIMHFGAVVAISKMRKEVFFRYLVLEIFARSLFDRISRVSFVFFNFGFIIKSMPKLKTLNANFRLFISHLPLIRMY